MDIKNKSQLFIDDYISLCLKHNLILIDNELNFKNTHISTINNGKIMGCAELLNVSEIFSNLKKLFK